MLDGILDNAALIVRADRQRPATFRQLPSHIRCSKAAVGFFADQETCANPRHARHNSGGVAALEARRGAVGASTPL
jgi:hypothetical protein